MRCIYCRGETRVVDSREVGNAIRRRRACQQCGRRFTTYERVELGPVWVVKRDGRREAFDREKLLSGLRKACAKRPISAEQLEAIADDIESRLLVRGETEVRSQEIGAWVMDHLRKLDEVAYVRFASVYRRFAAVEDLKAEIDRLLAGREEEG